MSNQTKQGNEPVSAPKLMSIKMIMNEFDLTYVYVNRAITKGWLGPVKKVAINKSKTQFKYVVDRDVVLKWRKRCDAKARRKDGRRKYNYYLSAEEKRVLDKIRKENTALQNAELKLANPPKNS